MNFNTEKKAKLNFKVVVNAVLTTVEQINNLVTAKLNEHYGYEDIFDVNDFKEYFDTSNAVSARFIAQLEFSAKNPELCEFIVIGEV